MSSVFGLTPAALAASVLLLSFALVLAGILMFTYRVFLHGRAGARPGYYQWERALIIGGFLVLALGLTGLASLLRQAGDPLLADMGLTAYSLGAVLLTVVEVSWLTKASLSEPLLGALLRLFVVLSFVGQAFFGAALLQTGLLPAWLGWTTLIWHVACLALMLRARDPYYPFMHLQLPLLAGLWLLAR